MEQDACRQLHAYWDALRAGRPAPERDEVDPAGIRGVLASVFVLDVAPLPAPRPSDAVFRLSGTRIDALFGRALRGTTFDRIWGARSAASAGAALDAVRDGGRPVTAAARGAPPDRKPLDLEMILLPLGGRGRSHVLGCLAASAVPDWMGLRAAAPLDLVSIRAEAAIRAGFGRRGRAFSVPESWGGAASPAADHPWLFPRAPGPASGPMNREFSAP